MADKFKKELIVLEDGFYYYWPESVGAFSSHILREIADELDRLNAPWQEQIDKYFEENPEPRPMTGFFETLTPEQRKNAFEFDGDDTIGPPTEYLNDR